MKIFKKLAIPVIVTVIFCAYMALFGFTALKVPSPWYIKLLLGGIPLLFTLAMLMVLYERYKEIKRGDDDDLSNY